MTAVARESAAQRKSIEPLRVIRSAKLGLFVDLPSIQADVAALTDGWIPHFQSAHYAGEWTALALRSIGGGGNETLPFPLGGEAAEYSATPLLASCPAIASLLESLACPVFSARLLKLKQGSSIKPHRDADLAFESGVARIHIPVFTNPDVEFLLAGERIVMEAGSCWYANVNLIHSVANGGDADRVHLVIDCAVDDWLRGRFAAADQSFWEERRSPEQLRQMIAALRKLDLPACPALIAQLEEELGCAG